MKKFALGFLGILTLGVLWSFFQGDSAQFADVNLILQAPSSEAWFGRDSLGRDLLTRIFHGAQVSLGLGISSSLAALLLGLLYGATSALNFRKVDQVLTRISEVLMALPSLMLMAVLALILQTQIFENNLAVIFWTLTLGSWMPVAKLSRNLILQERERDYIEAAQAIGAGPIRIFFHHMIPNILSPLFIYWSLQIPHAILAEGLLSFLGFGVKSPSISWGALLQEGWKTLTSYPHLLWGPSLFLFLTVFSLNILLEHFRKSFDPKLKWEDFS